MIKGQAQIWWSQCVKVQPPAIEAKESGQWKWKGKDEPSVKSWKRHEKTAGGEKQPTNFKKCQKPSRGLCYWMPIVCKIVAVCNLVRFLRHLVQSFPSMFWILGAWPSVFLVRHHLAPRDSCNEDPAESRFIEPTQAETIQRYPNIE